MRPTSRCSRAFSRAVATCPEWWRRGERSSASVGRLVKRAQKAGAVRRDIVAEDVPMLIASAINAAMQRPSSEPDLWRRYLGVVLDGLSPR